MGAVKRKLKNPSRPTFDSVHDQHYININTASTSNDRLQLISDSSGRNSSYSSNNAQNSVEHFMKISRNINSSGLGTKESRGSNKKSKCQSRRKLFVKEIIDETEEDYGKVDKEFQCPDNPNNPSKCNAGWHYNSIPFSEGTFKYAYLGHYCGVSSWLYSPNNNKKIGQRCVVKKWIKKRHYDGKMWEEEQKVYNLAVKMINEWNRLFVKRGMRKLTLLRTVDGRDNSGTVSAVESNYSYNYNYNCNNGGILEEKTRDYDEEDMKTANTGRKNRNTVQIVNVASNTPAFHEHVTVEDYLPGKFTKWNSNSGWTCDEDRIIQAFCHWTWHYSNGKYLYCDAQGMYTVYFLYFKFLID